MAKPCDQIIREAEAKQRALDKRPEPEPAMKKASAKDKYTAAKKKRWGSADK